MILDDALVAGRHQVRLVHVILLQQRWKQIVAVAVDGGERRARADAAVDVEIHRARGDEALVDEDVDRVGVIDRQQTNLVDVPDLPELCRKLQLIAALARLQGFSGDAEVLPRRRGGRVHRLTALPHQPDRHPQRAAPHDVGDETILLAIPGIEEGTRALEALQLQHLLVAAGEVDVLRHAIRPLDPQYITLQVGTQAEVCGPPGHDAGLQEIAHTERNL